MLRFDRKQQNSVVILQLKNKLKKITGKNIKNLKYANDTTLRAESKEELKSLLMRVKESEKASLKLSI